jgi:DNA polymerase-3 subunit beta
MHVTCHQSDLARGLATVGRAVATRSTMPVLANILMATDDSRLRLSATNLEIGITCWVPATVATPGEITVPARLLGEFVASLPQCPVEMVLDPRGQTLDVSADRYQAQIKGIDAADFPVLPTVEQGARFSMSAHGLRQAIAQVTVSAATDESRPILTGVLTHFDPDSGRMLMAAADGFRLSVRETDLQVPLDAPIGVIIPARALIELSRVCAEDETHVEVAITDTLSQILFRLTDVELVSQLIDGTFPDYEKIVPSTHSTRAVVNTRALHNAVRIASFFARDAANVVRLELQPAEDPAASVIVVTAQAAEVGANHSEIEATIEGAPVEVAFNAKYLLDLLNVVGTDQVVMDLLTTSSPGTFRPAGDTDFTHVIMPMHIGR